MKSLNAIGVECGTDKSTITHCYLDTYEKYLEQFKGKNITLWELGVAGGASILMWRRFLPEAKVYGIDINPDCAGEGIFIGDATDEVFINEVLLETGYPTIVIEDSSHVGWDMIKLFKMIFPMLEHGGYFFLEDTHAGLYNSHYEQGSGAFEFFTGLARDVDVAGRGMTGNTEYAINLGITEPPVPEYSRILDSFHIHPSLWIFKRK